MAKVNYCYLNGKILKEEDAKISVNDIGFLRGYGVFDFLRTHKGKPILLNEHLDRLFNSAKDMGIEVKQRKEELEEVVKNLLKKNNFPESKVRIVITGGITDDAITPNGQPTVLILMKKFKKPDSSLYKKGVKLITIEHLRENPKTKSTNYKNAIKLRKKVEKEDAFGLLYVHDGKVLEGTTYNVFIVKNDKIITPKKNVLIGATRNLVIKVASNGFEVEERDVSKKQLFEADEVFITSSSIDILPVIKIDKKKIGDGKPGRITKKLLNNYQVYLDKSLV